MIAEFWLLKKRQEYVYRHVFEHRNRSEIKSVEQCSTVEDFLTQFCISKAVITKGSETPGEWNAGFPCSKKGSCPFGFLTEQLQTEWRRRGRRGWRWPCPFAWLGRRRIWAPDVVGILLTFCTLELHGLCISLLKTGVVYTVTFQMLFAYHDLVEATVDLVHRCSVWSRLRKRGYSPAPSNLFYGMERNWNGTHFVNCRYGNIFLNRDSASCFGLPCVQPWCRIFT